MRTFIFTSIIGIFLILLAVNSCESNKEKISGKDSFETKSNLDLHPIQGNDDYQDCDPLYTSSGKYHYRITISNVSREWETYETQEMINGEVRLRKTSPDISYLNGTYDWYSDVYLPDENAMFNFICDHYETMKQHKISSYHDYGGEYEEYYEGLYN